MPHGKSSGSKSKEKIGRGSHRFLRPPTLNGSLSTLNPSLTANWVAITPSGRFRFREAGHLLGSAMVELQVRQNGDEQTLLFTGDLGQPNMPILRDPETVEWADWLMMESTYGNRDHAPLAECLTQLCAIVDETRRKGGRVLIPSFAGGRTQEVLYALNEFVESGQLNPLPVFVDSPMVREVLRVYQRHRALYDEATQAKLRQGDEPFTFPGLQLITTVDESKQLNTFNEPCVIIAGSGMATGGRIKHHLKHGIGDPRNAVVFVGFQAQGTLGRQLVDGVSPVRIFGEWHEVKARIYLLDGFSAHADKTALLQWTSQFREPPKQTFLVHGEPDAMASLADALRQRGWQVHLPRQGEEVTLLAT